MKWLQDNRNTIVICAMNTQRNNDFFRFFLNLEQYSQHFIFTTWEWTQ
jgi:hypothetical protein